MRSQLRSTCAGVRRVDGRLRRVGRKHVRVAADQLLAAVVGDLREVAGAALLEQQRQEVHLEEDVAELVEQPARRRRATAASASS